MKSEFDSQFWEYPWYFFVTVFLLAVGACLLLLGALKWIFIRVRKSFLSWPALAGAACLTGLVALGVVGYIYTHTISLGDRVVAVTVQNGDSFKSIADRLKKEGVIDYRWSLLYPARMLGIDRKLLPGTYVFTGDHSPRSVLAKIASSDILLTEVTIPEGMPIWKVASILHAKLQTDSTELLRLANDQLFLDSLGIPYLEGHLFPETYTFAPGVSLRLVVREMVSMFHRQTDSLWSTKGTLGLDPRQALILASIVEAETPLATERARVASVYLNRLRIGMPLDADPTVIYGLGGLDRPLLRDDLDSPSPYNTYRVGGLPPTPINSPGKASIIAALQPENTGYFYFVADGTGSGGHYFSRTNDEHNNARRRARLNERQLN